MGFVMSEILRKNKKIVMKRLREGKKVMMKRLCEDKEITMQRFPEDKKMIMKRLLRDGNKMMKKKKMSVSKDNIKYLPEDVIILILARLPVKILMRFKCVCKSWYHLIKSPTFINIHQRSKNKSILIKRENKYGNTVMFFHAYESLNIISQVPKIPHIYKNYNASWPCNGLLLCVSVNIDQGILVLCNPATREYKLLPPLPLPEYPNYCLVDKYGLGFDSKKNDYKVLIIVEVYDKDDNVISHETLVYNLSTNSWRQIIHNSPYVSYMVSTDVGVLFNGALHWLNYNTEIDSILSFDVSTEVFHDTKLPEAITQHHQICDCPTVVNDSFALFAISDPKFLEIWVMKDYGLVGSWTKIGRLLIPDTNWWYSHLLWKNNTILIETIKEEKEEKEEKVELVSYALDTHEITDMGILTNTNTWEFPGVWIYEESLVSIK